MSDVRGLILLGISTNLFDSLCPRGNINRGKVFLSDSMVQRSLCDRIKTINLPILIDISCAIPDKKFTNDGLSAFSSAFISNLTQI